MTSAPTLHLHRNPPDSCRSLSAANLTKRRKCRLEKHRGSGRKWEGAFKRGESPREHNGEVITASVSHGIPWDLRGRFALTRPCLNRARTEKPARGSALDPCSRSGDNGTAERARRVASTVPTDRGQLCPSAGLRGRASPLQQRNTTRFVSLGIFSIPHRTFSHRFHFPVFNPLSLGVQFTGGHVGVLGSHLCFLVCRLWWRDVVKVCVRRGLTKEARRTSKELQASFASVEVKVQTEQKRQPWESSKVKSTAEQKEHKGSSHFCQETTPSSPRRLEFFLLTELLRRRPSRCINTAMKNIGLCLVLDCLCTFPQC